MSQERALTYAAYMLLKSKEDTCISFLVKEQRFHIVRVYLDCPKENKKPLSFDELGDALSFYNQYRLKEKKPNNFQTSRIADYLRLWSESTVPTPARPSKGSLLQYWQQLHDHFKSDAAAAPGSEAQRSDESESELHAEQTSQPHQTPSNRKRKRNRSEVTRTQDLQSGLSTPPRRGSVTFATPLEDPGPSSAVSPSVQTGTHARLDESDELATVRKENKRLRATLEKKNKQISEERAAQDASLERAQNADKRHREAQYESDVMIFNMAARELFDTVLERAQMLTVPDSGVALVIKYVLERSGLYQDGLLALQRSQPDTWSSLTEKTLQSQKGVEFLYDGVFKQDLVENRLRIGAGAHKARGYGYCMALSHIRDCLLHKTFLAKQELFSIHLIEARAFFLDPYSMYTLSRVNLTQPDVNLWTLKKVQVHDNATTVKNDVYYKADSFGNTRRYLAQMDLYAMMQSKVDRTSLSIVHRVLKTLDSKPLWSADSIREITVDRRRDQDLGNMLYRYFVEETCVALLNDVGFDVEACYVRQDTWVKHWHRRSAFFTYKITLRLKDAGHQGNDDNTGF